MAKAKKEKSAFDDLKDAAKEAGKALGVPMDADKFVETGKEIFKVTTEFDGLTSAIKYSSANSIDAQANLAYLANAITRLHLPMQETYKDFTDIQEALEGSAIKGENVRQVFEGLATAQGAQVLSPEKFEKVADAFKEISQEGKVGVKQMQGLAAALPGAMELAAESMQMGSKKFEEALEDGTINGNKFIVNFSQKLKEHFEGGLAAAGQTIEAKMNDAQGTITQSMLDMGDRLRPVFAELMGDVKEALDSAPIQWFITNIGEVVKWVARAGETWVIYKGIMTGVEFVTKTFTLDEGILTVSMGEFTAMTDGATLAVEGLESVMATLGVGALAAGIAYLVEKILQANAAFDAGIEKLTHFKEVSDGFKTVSKTYDDLNLTWSGIGRLNADEKTTFFSRMQEESTRITDELNIKTLPALDSAKKALSSLPKPVYINNKTQSAEENGIDYLTADEMYRKKQQALEEDINNMQAAVLREKGAVDVYKGRMSTLQKMGVKPVLKPTFANDHISPTHETQKAEGSKALTINIKINDLVKELNLHSTTIQGGAKQIKDIITEVLLSAVNDSQQIAHD